MMQLKGMSPAHMWIEILGDRAHWKTRKLCDKMIEKIMTSKPLRVPEWSEFYGY